MENPHHINEDLNQIMQRLQFKNQELETQLHLVNRKVKEMIAAKDVWIKDVKNQQKKAIFFAREREVKDIVYPKPVPQARIDFLGQ